MRPVRSHRGKAPSAELRVHESVEVKIARLEERFDDMDEQLDAISSDLKEVRKTLSHQRGFLAGVVFAISAVWVAGIALWQTVLRA